MPKAHLLLTSQDTNADVDALVDFYYSPVREKGDYVYKTEQDKADERPIHETIFNGVELYLQQDNGTVIKMLLASSDICALADLIERIRAERVSLPID